MSLNAEKVGAVIAQIRGKRKLARPDVARSIGVTSNYLGLVEAGKRTLSITTLSKLAEALGVPESFIACLGTDEPRPHDPRHRFAPLLRATQKAMMAAIDTDEGLKLKR